MFRIRQIDDPTTPSNARSVRKVQAMLAQRFPGVRKQDIESVPDHLRDPVGYRFRALLFVAEDARGRLLGFALVYHDPEIGFCFLDFLAADEKLSPGGAGAALYDRVREGARALGAKALFFEVLPDEPEAVSDPKYVTVNAARLRFYERFGARPIVDTGYETPVKPGGKDLPHLMYDDLGRKRPLRVGLAREAVRAILERKYAHLCPPEYVEMVIRSFKDDPVHIRPPRYTAPKSHPKKARARAGDRIALVVNDRHQIHHVRERGYFESPVRIKAILDGILPTGLFRRIEPRVFPVSWIRKVHEPALVEFLEKASASMPMGETMYPYVFPIRNAARLPKALEYRAGYFCIDTFTPIHRNAYLAAKRGVDCALTAAARIVKGDRFAYALVRPPGHHAERRAFGGFCYFNNAAVAAEYLSRMGRVAILDIDYHHGNGQQEIFYGRSDVLTVSIHGEPNIAYPFFSGFAEERGTAAGEGYNLNIPLPEHVEGPRYRRALQRALQRVLSFAPSFLVVSLGLDTAKRDPTGSWSLGAADFEENGRLIGELGLRTLVVQEGGYRSAAIGTHARRFFEGLVGARRA